MTVTSIFTLLLTFVSTYFLLRPIWETQTENGPSQSKFDDEAYKLKNRLADLELDYQTERIDEQDFQANKKIIEDALKRRNL